MKDLKQIWSEKLSKWNEKLAEYAKASSYAIHRQFVSRQPEPLRPFTVAVKGFLIKQLNQSSFQYDNPYSFSIFKRLTFSNKYIHSKIF